MAARDETVGGVMDRGRLVTASREGPLDAHATMLRDLLGCDAVLVTVVDDRAQHFLGLAGVDGDIAEARSTELSLSLCAVVADTEAALVVDDLAHHPTLQHHAALTDLGIRSYAGMPLRASDGTAVGSVCGLGFAPRAWSSTDTSAVTGVRDLVESALEPVLRQVQDRERTAEIALLLSTLRHELGGDLSVVLGGLETALLPGLEEGVRNHVLRNARRECRRVIEALDALLRMDSRAPTRLATVDLAEVIARAVETSATTTEPARVLLAVPSLSLTTEPVLVSHIVRNLVDNACKYSAGVVTITAERTTAGRVAVSVTDEGGGLPPEVARQLYEPFARGRGDQSAPGFGLGLYIIRTLADRLGADLAVASSEAGTTIRLLLPG